ncbi:MAG: putative aminohydrolase SsnA [Anaerolineales bacterium]|nr:putative aminohydrolase SsnA [Anaerolineales bacterium]
MSMLITHGTLVTFGDDAHHGAHLIENGALHIDGDHITDVGKTSDLRAMFPDAEVLDAGGKLVMPGNICAHTHSYGAFARGLAIAGPPMKSFPEILARLWWQLDRSLDEEAIRYSTLVPLVDAVRHGTTTLIDHHASNRAIDGSLDIIADAVEEAGIRACLCYEVTDRDGSAVAEAGIRENERFIRRARELEGELGERLAGTFGLHASLTLTDETLEQCVDVAERLGVGFHIHAAEGPADREHALETYDTRTIDRLAERGILGEQTIVAHAIDIDAWEMETLRDTGTWVTHQPRSNMNNAVGVADVPAMLRGGMPVGLGNDGFSNNMFTEMKTAYLLHKVHRDDPRVMGADQVLKMAVNNNARLANLFFPQPIGQLSPGAYADVILLDYYPPTPLTAGNLPWHVAFGIDGSHVTHTICGGRLLMKDRELLTLDEEAIAGRAREVARDVWKRFEELSGS